jgi:ubiquinone/menaquinone biosynthesis C-methylase UbiE
MNDRVFKGELAKLRDPARLKRLAVDRVIKHSLQGLRIESVLDIGTGTGVFAQGFVKQCCRVAGIDSNKAMIREAKRFVPEGIFKTGSAEKIPFKNHSFDLVFLGLVLHETDDFYLALAEAARVARKRIAVLEWPYKSSKHGPPLAHRLKSELIKKAALQAGVKKVTLFRIKQRVLYRLDLL